MSDDFIRSFGNLACVNTWLKLISLTLLLLVITLGAALTVKVIESRKEHILPIVINSATGDAMAVDYNVIDSRGEERAPVEVRKFCEDFLSEAFNFNRFTVRSHLDNLDRYSTPEALNQIRSSLNLPRRADLIGRNAQGLFELTSFMITESNPSLKTQVYFQTRVFAGTGEVIEETGQLAVMTIKPVRRSVRNPHGLLIVEYRQNPFNNPNHQEE